MLIASWNVNSLKVRLPHVLRWLEEAGPDVLALQETKLEDPWFPVLELQQAGYRCAFAGQRTYNGVALVARERPRDIVTDIPGLDDPERRILAATVGALRVINLYVVNGKSVDDPAYARKLEWLARVHDFVAAELQQHEELVVLGDFNIAPDDRDVHDPEHWHERILCSTPERAALGALLDLGLHDSYRLLHAAGGQFSWWDYRGAAFARNEGLRIDLVLVSDALKKRVRDASIDAGPRGWERPSDHAPACLQLNETQ